MKDTVTTVIEILGLALVTVGIGLVFVPAAFVAAGVGLIAISYLSTRGVRR